MARIIKTVEIEEEPAMALFDTGALYTYVRSSLAQNAPRLIDKKEAAYWDGKNNQGESVSSGVYFYTIIAKDFIASRKMVLIR